MSSQRELTSFLMGEMFLEQRTDAAPSTIGNAAPEHALQGCFRCAGGGWIAVTVEHGQMAALGRCIGVAEGEASGGLAGWALAGPAQDRVAALQAAGIAAAPVQGGRALADAAPSAGGHAFATTPDGALIKAMPFQLDSAPFAMSRDAPGVGQDTRAVLREVGGYSDAEIDAMAAGGAVECGMAG